MKAATGMALLLTVAVVVRPLGGAMVEAALGG